MSKTKQWTYWDIAEKKLMILLFTKKGESIQKKCKRQKL